MGEFSKDLDAAKELAIRAGAILLDHYASPAAVEWKGANDPVTSADREASRFLVGELGRRFPSDAILCEEEKDDRRRLRSTRVWILDPMDGTKEFIARNGEFAVMIGLAVDGVARLGAVYQPTERKLYYAATGEGAFFRFGESETALRVSPESDLANATMALSRSHLSTATESVRKRLGIERFLQTGSLGLKVGLVCEGKAHVYVQGLGTSLWDTCGPEAILHEAGGLMTDATGIPLRYDVEDVRNLKGVVVTNGVLHERVIEAVQALKRPGE